MKNALKLLFLLTVLFATAFAAEEEKKSKREAYSAVIVGTGGRIGGRTLNINIIIDQRTTDQQVQDYLVLLQEEGQDALRKKLEKVEVGRIAPAASTGTDIAVARVFSTDEGKIIRLVAARPVPFLEAWRHGRSMDYPFTIMELQLNQEGKGEGAIIGGAQLEFNEEGQLDIESYGNQYAKLVNVRSWD